MQEALAISKKVLGAEHPTVAIRLNNIAGLFKAQVRLWLLSELGSRYHLAG